MVSDEKNSTHSQENVSLFKEVETENFMDRYDLRKLFLGVQRHLLVILLSVLLWTALGSYVAYSLMTTYEAESVVLYQEDVPKSLSGGYTLTNLSLPTVLDMIKLPAHFQAVKSILGLDLSAKQLETMTDVPTPRNSSNLIRIITKGDNPNLVIDIANTLARVSVKSSQEFTQKQLQIALDNFKSQLEIARQKLTSQLQAIEDFKKTNQYFAMDAEYTSLLKEIADAQARLQNATLRYNSLLVEYENLKREVDILPDQVVVTTSALDNQFNPLQTRISNIEASLSEARSKYAKGNPKIRALEEELEGLIAKGNEAPKKELTREKLEKNPVKEKLNLELMLMQGKVRSAQKTKQDIALSAAKLQKQLEHLPSLQIAFSKLLQEKQIDVEQVKFLNTAMETTQLMVNIPKGSIELYQLADKAKTKDAWWVDLLPVLGLLFGLGSGILIAMFLEMRDNKLWTPKQIDLAYHLPVLTVMPEMPFFSKKNAQERTLFFIRTLSERLERTVKKLPDSSLKDRKTQFSIACTSSIDKEGKSCIAYYLANYYQKIGKKTLLIEFDPRQNPFADEAPAPAASLENYLNNHASLNDIISHGYIDRIRLEKPDPNMKELIKSEQMVRLWNDLNKNYDIIILDAPGIIKENYALNLCAMADLCLFIIGSSQVPKNVIDESLKELNLFGIRPCGIVLNRVLPVYIDDERIKQESKKSRNKWLQNLMFWKG